MKIIDVANAKNIQLITNVDISPKGLMDHAVPVQFSYAHIRSECSKCQDRFIESKFQNREDIGHTQAGLLCKKQEYYCRGCVYLLPPFRLVSEMGVNQPS